MYRFEWNYGIKTQKRFNGFVDDMRNDFNMGTNYEQAARLFYADGNGYYVMVELQVPTVEMFRDGEKHMPWLDAYEVKSLEDYDASNEIYTGIGNGEVITFENAEELMLKLAKELCEED